MMMRKIESLSTRESVTGSGSVPISVTDSGSGSVPTSVTDSGSGSVPTPTPTTPATVTHYGYYHIVHKNTKKIVRPKWFV